MYGARSPRERCGAPLPFTFRQDRQFDSMALTSKQARHLRALGHHLDPVVHLGKAGVTEALQKAIDAALIDHELVKVKLNPEATEDRHEAAAALALALKAELAQVLGRTFLLYRKHPSQPKIKLP